MTANKTDLATYITDGVIAAHSVPHSLKTADGDSIRDLLMQALHDIADELDMDTDVDFDAAGAVADVAIIDCQALDRVYLATDQLADALEDIPRDWRQ